MTAPEYQWVVVNIGTAGRILVVFKYNSLGDKHYFVHWRYESAGPVDGHYWNPSDWIVYVIKP